MKKIIAWIGEIGPSPNFVAFQAHCWYAACMVMVSILLFKITPLMTIIMANASIIWKEFWFDLRYEKPAQTIVDGFRDTEGYECGVLIGIIFSFLIIHFGHMT